MKAHMKPIINEKGIVNFHSPLEEAVVMKVYVNGKYSHQQHVSAKTTQISIAKFNDYQSFKVVVGPTMSSPPLHPKRTKNTTDENRIYNGERVLGYLDENDYYSIVEFTVNSQLTLILEANDDFDLYATFDAELKNFEYVSATYSATEKLTIKNPQSTPQTLYVMVYRFSGYGNYALTVVMQDDVAANGTLLWSPESKKIALISGISDYLNISDLSFCDEDTVDWYNHLSSQGYECRVLGDNHPTNYSRFDGLATKSNLRQAVQLMRDHPNAETIAFVSSGHGAGDGRGASYLNTYAGGSYTDTELVADIGSDIAKKKIVVLDHCYSGGFKNEFEKVENLFFMAACGVAGFGYDMSEFSNGLLTYSTMTSLLPISPLELIFQRVSKCYDGYDEKDKPVHTNTLLPSSSSGW
jgi:hypothetical protein